MPAQEIEEFARRLIERVRDPVIKLIDLGREGDGELCGWYMGGKDGWRARFSSERFVDYYGDLEFDSKAGEEGDPSPE